MAAARMRTLPWLGRFSLSAGGLGYARFAPGTWGSLPPCVAAALLVCSGQPVWVINVALVLLGLWGAVACVRFGGWAEGVLKTKDPSCVVADEVAGMCIALAGLQWWTPESPHAALAHSFAGSWWWKSGAQIALAFLFFRLFDVLKPPPCRQVQHIHGGWGILLDDILAGVYASVCVHLLTFAQ